ncbi:MAG: hypothetical protein P4L91_09250 [Burkholderiaceae bacterium]|nr:hypothetical protein [Burkholderiaceae bacterium]
MQIQLSQLDHDRFGIITAKAADIESIADLDDCVAYCKSNKVELLIARIDTSRVDTFQKMEAIGGVLCDTLLYYELNLRRFKSENIPGQEFIVRAMAPMDRDAVLTIAREAFSGYFGHYHSDPRLSRKACDDTYVSWCESTINNLGDVDKLLVAEDSTGVCGFVTSRVHENERLELALGGVSKRVVGRGVFHRLIQAGIQDGVNSSLKHAFTSTQSSNLASQRVCLAYGFAPSKSVHTFHKWFDI